MIKFKKILLVVIPLFVFGLFLNALSSQHTVPIVMYHHVAKESNEELNTISPENFEKHMAYISENGYRVVTFDQLVTSIKDRKPLPHNSVVITFDDGYENNYTNAFPVLKHYNFPATIFVVTNRVDQKEYLTTVQINEMIESGLIEIGSHTKNHQYLPKAANQTVLEDEIIGSKKDLEALLKRPINYFCYPSGGFSESIKKIVQLAGYKGACTTNRGFKKQDEDVFELKRIRFNNADYNLSLMIKLSGFYTIFKKDRNPY